MSMGKLLSPKTDVVFHCLFRKGNENITKALVSAILDKEVKEIKLDNDRYLLREYPDEKIGILDLSAKLDGGILCNIEIQLLDEGNIEKRILQYWSRKYSEQIVIGEDYKKLKKTIVILIADFRLKSLKEVEKYHTEWQIMEEKSGKVLTEDLELHIISLPKARKIENKNNELMQWLKFLDNPNKEEVLDVAKKNQDIADALWKLEDISEDKKLRRIAELKERWARDERNRQQNMKEMMLEIRNGKNEIKEGKLEIEEGKQEIEEAKKELEEEKQKLEKKIQELEESKQNLKKFEIAQKMLKENISIEIIEKITGLKKEEIENLK